MLQQEILEETVSSSPLTKSRDVLAGGIIAVVAVSAWMFLIVNRYLTIHEGWFSYYGYLMRHGAFPYRDFYFFTQPLHLLIADAVTSIGNNLLYYRYYGLFERVLITAALYLVLSRSFTAGAAICGTVASSILFLAYPTDAFASYLYTCLLLLLLTLACLFQAWQSSRHQSLWMFLTGVAAGLCFFSKQSNGALVIVSTAATIAFCAEGIRRGTSDLVKYFAGVLLACLPFVCWLMFNGAWGAYVSQVFLGAASSKGGLGAVLFGFVSRQLKAASIVAFLLIIAVLGILFWRKKLLLLSAGVTAKQIPQWMTFVVIAGTVLANMALVHHSWSRRMWVMANGTEVLVNVVLYALPAALAYVLYCRFTPRGMVLVRANQVPIALLIASFFWTYGCGMSWNVAEQSLIPSLAVLLAFFYDRVQWQGSRYVSAIVVLASIGIISMGVWHKWSLAFNWEGWFEAISEHPSQSKYSEISDYKLDRGEIKIYDTILDDIRFHTKPNESIITFPTIPLFNFVGSHPQPTFAPVHYWDVCPDEVARRDAERVKAAKPRIIVELLLDDWVWLEHDTGWRGGRRSGQRDFQDTLNILTSSGEYRLLHCFLTPSYKMPVQVWLRIR